MQITKGVVAAQAGCRDCEMRWHGDNARRQAYDHNRNTGHTTSVEVVTAYIYEGEEDDE